MKFKSILAVVSAAALLATSCSKDDNSTPSGAGEPARVNVSVTSPDTRAKDNTGNTLPGDQVDNFSVFITDNTGEIKWKGYSNDGSALAGASAISVSTSAQHVYIVANGGDLTTAITTKAALDSYTIDMATASQDQTLVRWASGSTSAPLSFTQNASGDFEASTTVSLKFIAARITLKINNSMTGYDGTEDGTGPLVLREVAVVNAVSTSKLFGNRLVPATKHYLTGIDGNAQTPAWSPFPAAGDYTVSTPLMLDNITADDFTSQYYYYVFENDAVAKTSFPTIITIRGEVKGKDTYYPVHLAPYEVFLSGTGLVANGVERGNSYDITIDLKVDPTDGGGGGTGPVDPIVTATVDVSVNLTPWNPVTLGKEFN